MLKDYYRFTSTNYHFLSFGLLTAFFGNFGQTFFIAWFGDSIQQDFNLSAGEYGLLYSSATLTSGFIILYAGALLDKTDLRKFTFITSLGLIAGCGLMYFSEYAWQLVIAIFLLRFCGQGLMFHIAFTSMARYFNDNRGKAIGIVGVWDATRRSTVAFPSCTIYFSTRLARKLAHIWSNGHRIVLAIL